MKLEINDIIWIFLSSSSIAWAITKGIGLKKIREAVSIRARRDPNFFKTHFDILMNCPFCMGFWTSPLCYGLYVYCGAIGQFIVFALTGALVSLLIFSLTRFLKDY